MSSALGAKCIGRKNLKNIIFALVTDKLSVWRKTLRQDIHFDFFTLSVHSGFLGVTLKATCAATRTGKGEKSYGPMEEACSLQPMNESGQKSIWDNTLQI